MRLATIFPESGNKPLAAVSVDAENWVALHPFLKFFGTNDLPQDVYAPLEQFLPVLMPRFSELTRKVSDWPEHGRVFQKDGGKTLRARRFFSPVLRPSTFRDFSAFEQHVRTARAKGGEEMHPSWYEIPVFYFSNPNSFVGDNDSIFAPAGTAELDYGLELGVVIGKRCRNASAAQAWNCVAGFTIINDFAARDIHRSEMPIGLGPSKGKDFATAMGPMLVTRDEFAGKISNETISLGMSARVNGRELSRGNSSFLYHTFPKMIAHASRDADLFPGDVIGSGTVGFGCILELGPENTGGWLKAGDLVELEIERLGVLRTRIAPRTS